MCMLVRVWTSLVAGVAGAAVGMALAVVLVMLGVRLDVALWTIAAGAVMGLTGGFVLAKGKQASQ